MKSGKLPALFLLINAGICTYAQTQPNLDNGFKPYGSYDQSSLDSVNLQNGNLVLHIPMPFSYPQRGNRLTPKNVIRLSTKAWAVAFQPGPNGGGSDYWHLGFGPATNLAQMGTGIGLDHTMDLALHRIVQMETGGGGFSSFGHYLTTWDGSVHSLVSSPNAPLDANQNPMAFDAVDNSGYHIILSNPNFQTGIPSSAVVTDRNGNRYQIAGWATFCGKPVTTGYVSLPFLPSTSLAEQQFESEISAWDPSLASDLDQFGNWHRALLQDTIDVVNSSSTTVTTCQQAGRIGVITDANGNVINSFFNATPGDTMGRPLEGITGATETTDYSGCVSPGPNNPITGATIYNYPAFGGSNNQVKICSANFTIQTNFGVSGITEYQNATGNNGVTSVPLIVTVIFSDAPNWSGTRWTFNYDSYLNPTDISLSTGGSIHYDWTQVSQPNCGTFTPASRAVAARTVNDNNGHTFTWRYTWGAASNGTVTNQVTDPSGNDTMRVFTALGGCLFYEIRTQTYQGTGSSRQLLKQVDTTYSGPTFFDDTLAGANGGAGNIVPIAIKTTAFPSGRVSLVTKTYDAGPGNGVPIFGNVLTEKIYDWGQGAPGPLIREVDNTYEWQADTTGNYLSMRLLDLPATTIVKDGNGNRLAETDYFYDEPSYLSNSGITTQHGAPPGPVRGNLTTVKKWLNTTGAFITSHTNWYDTGEVYQELDPLAHTTTLSYDSYYVGAYTTKTCNALNQCVSGTYDFNTGLLTSFTDQNASTQANGNSPGDSNHTSNYSYDLMSRLTLAQFPPDNAGNRPQTSFTYSTPNTLPMVVQRQKAVTTTANDIATSYFDGLGRPYRTQHTTPSTTASLNGNGIVTMDTIYDALDHPVQVTNPYFLTTDSTFGVVQTQYDGLGRVTQTTEQDGSIAGVSYTDNCTITTDEAGKLRRGCTNALGQLTSVDEPGDSTATASPVVSGGGAGATGWVTISGSEQSTSVYNPPSGSGGGGCDPGVICDGGGGGGGGYTTVYDVGTVSLTVNGVTYTTQYGQNDTPSTIAANLASAVNQDQFAVVTASASGATVTLMSLATGTQISYSLSASWTWDTTDFTNPSFTATTFGGVSGGTDGAPVFSGHAYTTLYNYDALGNLLKVTQQGGTNDQTKWRVRTFTYDSLSRLLTANNPELGTITYSYDAAGNLLTKTDARGVTATYTYDSLNRVTYISYSDGVTPYASFVYDQVNASTSNGIGHLTSAWRGSTSTYIYGTSQKYFSYDALGRITVASGQEPSELPGTPWKVIAVYDLAGDLTSLTYPSGRTIKYSYNSAAQLDQVTYDNWNGNSSGYVYWSVNDSNFYANGTPKLVTLGNGVTEATALNTRLQLSEDTVTNGNIGTLADHAYSYGTQGTNNGNILSVADQLNPARTQTFTYDPLNRLATANESRWGLSFVYDPWGNRLQQNVTAGSAGGSNLTVDSNNRIMGAPSNCTSATTYCYDLAGNLLNDGFHKYVFDAESRISNVDGGNAAYLYDVNGNRVRKDISGGPRTEYVYFGGQAVAELDVTNNYWTDYISAGGKRIAKADTFINMARTQGTCSTPTSGCKSTFWFRNSGLIGYKIQSGDKLYITQNVSTNSLGGPGLTYRDANGNVTQGDAITNVFDQNGCPMNQDCSSWVNYYRFRRMDLTPLAGMTIADDPLVETTWTSSTSGSWEALWGDFVLVSADGTVRPIFAGTQWGQSISMTSSNQAGTSNVLGFIDKELCWMCVGLTTNFYHDDQIGSSRLLTAAGGWPVWQGTFLPYGEEYNPQITSNHYKFSGKERDNESGLDYFGARYYGNTLGRFLTPDWATSPEPVPYADFNDPQSLNQYSYVRNAPTSKFDAKGHNWFTEQLKRLAVGVAKGLGASVTLQPPNYNRTTFDIFHTPNDQKVQEANSMARIPKALEPKGATETVGFALGAGLTVLPGVRQIGGMFSKVATGAATDELLQGAANRAAASVGSGSGPVYGTAVHSAFRAEVNALGEASLTTEQSYLNGTRVPYGTPGSVRVDVAVGQVDNPTAIYDLKTGGATLTPSRTQQIQANVPKLPDGSSVPVKEVRPQ